MKKTILTFVIETILVSLATFTMGQVIEVNTNDVILRSKNLVGSIVLKQGGDVEYNHTDPTDWLNGFIINVNGYRVRALGVIMNNNSLNYSLYGDGTIEVKGVVIHSDSTAKSNIRNLDSQLQKIRKLQGVSYQWKDSKDIGIKGDKRTYGILAQDLEKVYPDMVFTNEKGFKGIFYDELTTVLLESVKEQQILIEQQQATIEGQAKMLTSIGNRLADLEKKNVKK